ncbi:huntingtin-interacting protein K-like [Ylistrum balloti]|uniref:huntingtin-interacting protein K-like n=1 Tax=Pecten maximus TaxID=6579 RepID=UPI0014582999|nr:huntingtin-interacting protein K-like [Pecten maximus]XP_060080092.1 huntingtin-interacting protein K-like [Ylistrum balloti]
MAGPEDNQTEGVEVEEENKALKTKKHDSGAADLEKVTDYVEETEISAQSIGDAMKAVSDRKAKERAERQERERELAKVKINKEDVDIIVNEMEISAAQAERKLREFKGDLVSALVELTN